MPMVLVRTAVVAMCLTLLLTLTGLETGAQSTEGCSVGFWKNHVAFWPSPYTSATTVNDVGFSTETALALFNIFSNEPMLNWLSFSGGPASQSGEYRILLRAFAASLLNAAHPSVHFGLSSLDVVNEMNALFAVGGGRSAILAQASRFESLNNMGCPLE